MMLARELRRGLQGWLKNGEQGDLELSLGFLVVPWVYLFSSFLMTKREKRLYRFRGVLWLMLHQVLVFGLICLDFDQGLLLWLSSFFQM